jgi:hypothetical protein
MRGEGVRCTRRLETEGVHGNRMRGEGVRCTRRSRRERYLVPEMLISIYIIDPDSALLIHSDSIVGFISYVRRLSFETLLYIES